MLGRGVVTTIGDAEAGPTVVAEEPASSAPEARFVKSPYSKIVDKTEAGVAEA